MGKSVFAQAACALQYFGACAQALAENANIFPALLLYQMGLQRKKNTVVRDSRSECKRKQLFLSFDQHNGEIFSLSIFRKRKYSWTD